MTETIMIVDDSKDTVDMVKRLLESEGYKTIVALNGKEALKILKNRKESERPDLVLLDMFMPEMSGREVCDRIRNDQDINIRNVKIAFFTVAAFQDYGRQMIQKMNVLDYIVKPFDVDDFLRRIRKMILK
jgi:CheY-like chemotaxis protein